MRVRFLIFITLVASVLGLSAFYVGARITTWSYWAARHREGVWLSLSLVVVLQFLGPYLYRVFPDHRNRLFFVHWATYSALGVLTCMFFYTVAADILGVFWRIAFPGGGPADIELFAMSAMVLGTVVVGTVQAAMGPRVYRVEVPLRDLPAALEGFRIVQITDLHLGPTIHRRYTRHCVELANALRADVIALTGDFVDGSVKQLRSAIEPIRELKAKHGAYFVTGNHEYYWGAHAWLKEIDRLGIRGLVNEHVVIHHNGARLALAGVTDYSAARMVAGHASDPGKALAGAPADAVKIVLAHHPASYKSAAEAGADLQLSGHTHGGQFFPFSVLVRLTHRYYKGLRRFKNMWIYVSRGTGYWGPPLRFGVPAEITLISLRRA